MEPEEHKVGLSIKNINKKKPARNASQSDAGGEEKSTKEAIDLQKIKTLSEKTIQKLKQAGFDSLKKLSKADVADLKKIEGIGEARAKKILLLVNKSK